MPKARNSVSWVVALALLGTVGGAQTAAAEDRPGVGGQVVSETSPLASAGVYAYQVSDLKLHKVLTDPQGRFLFQDLPAGIYQIIAHKAGFVPALVKLHRATSSATQFVELQLVEARAAARPSKQGGADFWSLRAQVPADVLRDIELAEIQEIQRVSFSQLAGSPAGHAIPLAGFETRLQAMTGVGQIASLGDGSVSEGRVGIGGRVGPLKVDLDGRFSQFNAEPLTPAGSPSGAGQTSALSLVAAGPDSRFRVTSLTNRMVPVEGLGGRGGLGDAGAADLPVDFEHYQVSWSQGLGQNGRLDSAAQYTAETNFHRQGLIDPVIIPDASRTLRVEGAYTTALGERTQLQTGARYRERRFAPNASSRPDDQLVQANLDLFGRGGIQVRPAFLVEYGLYSTLSDGSLALTPQGGIVLQLGSDWQAKASASHRIYQEAAVTQDFLPTLFGADDLCELGSDSCYELLLSHSKGDDEAFSIGAVHRGVGETLRLYFSDDVFDRLESLYLVPGDKLPELQVSVTRRISPKVLTTLRSSLAAGGGGTFQASNRQPYENQVRYMVTSLDTQFESTSTGVFIAFHHVAQSLEPTDGLGGSVAEMEMERLRLQVSQDLRFLLDFAADWAVKLNMEVSRGLPSPASAKEDHELRRSFVGGLAVKF